MKFQYNVTEKMLRRELKARMASESDPLVIAQIHQSIEQVREGAAKRAERRAKQKEATPSRTDKPAYPPPVRWEFESDESWAETQELYRLDLKEDSAYEVLDSPKSNLRQRQDAERELRKIEDRRRELDPEGFAAGKETKKPVVPVVPKTPSEMSDTELIERFNFERIFGSDTTFISSLLAEIEGRKTITRAWKVSGTDRCVKSNGQAVTLMIGTVCVGEIPNPDPPVTNAEEPFKPSATPLQRLYWERRSRQ